MQREELAVTEILSKSTQSLVQNPAVREAVHSLLESGDRPAPGQPVSVKVDADGAQVELTRQPSTGGTSQG